MTMRQSPPLQTSSNCTSSKFEVIAATGPFRNPMQQVVAGLIAASEMVFVKMQGDL
jgi:hypothetical protein